MAASSTRDAAQKEMIAKVLNCPAPDKLKQHSKEFEKNVYKVTDGVHVAVGYAIANSILIEAPHGLIVVDTTEGSVNMAEIWTEFRNISKKPLKGVIYTHSHTDHKGGTEAIMKEGDKDIEVWAHEKFMEIRVTYDTLLKGVMTPRNLRQFGIPLEKMDGVVNCGIGPRIQASHVSSVIWPTHIMEGVESKDINIAGLDLQLVYIPGETECQMGVWIPSKRVFLPGDNFYRTFPNLYAIRGTVPRIVTNWIASLDTMRKLRPQYLVPSHTKPLEGEELIYQELTNYRDGITFVHDQTVRLMNRGLHPVEVAKSVKLPPSLRDNPWLQTFYGTPEWSSRAIYDCYIGWFSGSVEELFPLTPSDRAQKMVTAFGAEKILEQAECALSSGDIQWCLELSSHVYLATSSTAAKDLRSRAILALAQQQVSANGRNYLLTSLLEDHGVFPKLYPVAKVAMIMPLQTVLKRMACCIKAEEVEGLTLTVRIKFTELNQTYSFFVRNCVLEFQPEERSVDSSDLTMSLTSEHLKQIISGKKTVKELFADKSIEIDKREEVLYKFFNCFELGDEFLEKKERKERKNVKQ